jgi:hypothetical protein
LARRKGKTLPSAGRIGQVRPPVDQDGERRAYGVGESAERVADELALTGADFENRYGKNYWLAVLYRTLAAHDDFCDGGFEALKAAARSAE